LVSVGSFIAVVKLSPDKICKRFCLYWCFEFKW